MALSRVVITGVGLTSPLGNNLSDFRSQLLAGKCGLSLTDIRHMGKQVAGLCDFDETKHQKRKAVRRGTRAGSISVYCAREAIENAAWKLEEIESHRVGVYVGITEHGNVETENEIHDLYQNNLDTSLWSHHHNPRTVANNPAGEVTLNLKLHGPHYTIGGACAAGNLGLIQGYQMLQLGEVDYAIAGGVSESPRTFGIFAAFASQGALGFDEDPSRACRPLDINRKGIAISEGGALYCLERLEDALARKASILGEIIGYAVNSDATDYVLPNVETQMACMEAALKKADLRPQDIDLVSLHATGTQMGDAAECEAVGSFFRDCEKTKINCTKGFIGHAMGAAGALELAGNLPSFWDGKVHPIHQIDEVDPKCNIPQLMGNEVIEKETNIILNNAFGMLGINSSVLVKKFKH